MTIGQKNYANFLDDLEARVKSGKYKPKWADKKTIDKKHPQAKTTNSKVTKKNKTKKIKKIKIPQFGIQTKSGKEGRIELDDLPKPVKKYTNKTSNSNGEIHVKGFCVKAHTRNKNGKTINVKGYCVKAHTRRRKN